MEHEFYMKRAIELARQGMEGNHGGPFGAVVVKDNKIIGEGFNRVISSCDPTAHAEIIAIRDACRFLGSFQLEQCTLYASSEPCPMCLGAIYWARPQRVLYALTREDAAAIGFDDDFIYQEIVKDGSQRQIPFENMLRDEARVNFIRWMDKADKIGY